MRRRWLSGQPTSATSSSWKWIASWVAGVGAGLSVSPGQPGPVISRAGRLTVAPWRAPPLASTSAVPAAAAWKSHAASTPSAPAITGRAILPLNTPRAAGPSAVSSRDAAAKRSRDPPASAPAASGAVTRSASWKRSDHRAGVTVRVSVADAASAMTSILYHSCRSSGRVERISGPSPCRQAMKPSGVISTPRPVPADASCHDITPCSSGPGSVGQSHAVSVRRSRPASIPPRSTMPYEPFRIVCGPPSCSPSRGEATAVSLKPGPRGFSSPCWRRTSCAE